MQAWLHADLQAVHETNAAAGARTAIADQPTSVRGLPVAARQSHLHRGWGSLNISNVFGDHAALQVAPAKTSVYGYIGTNATADTTAAVTIASTAGAEAVSYTVNALINAADGTWKAYLKPGAAGGVYTITAGCTHGCTGTASIADVTFGDVWYCAGQSNMALPVQYTYARNASIANIKRGGVLSKIRLTGLKGNMNASRTP